MTWYKKCKKVNKIPGGKADGIDLNEFDQVEIEKGKNVEFEHSEDPDIAREIASDHLEEHPEYYIALKHMEDMLTELEKKRKK